MIYAFKLSIEEEASGAVTLVLPGWRRLFAWFFVSDLIVCRVYLPKCRDFYFVTTFSMIWGIFP